MAWRDTALSTKVFGIDGRSLFPMAIWALHWSWTTFYISVAGVALFALLQFFNISLYSLIKTIPRVVTSNKRYPVPPLRYFRRFYRD